MKQWVFTANNLVTLKTEIEMRRLEGLLSLPGSLLMQVYTMPYDQPDLTVMVEHLLSIAPEAVLVGASTIGEVVSGRVQTGTTLWIFTLFESSTLTVFSEECVDGEELTLGKDLATRLQASLHGASPTGIFFLATPLSMDVPVFLSGFTSIEKSCPIFGGGAGDYAAMRYSWVLRGHQSLEQGVVMVAFSGDALKIRVSSLLGWKPLSRTMIATRVEGLRVHEIDGETALSVYQRYVNTEEGENFGVNAAEFPFLLERDGRSLARVPILAGNDGSLQFMADIQPGEPFRLGYGDPGTILDSARDEHGQMAAFGPQGVFVYICGARRFLMQEDSELETRPFEEIAPTGGFYTYGEFNGLRKRCHGRHRQTWPPDSQETSASILTPASTHMSSRDWCVSLLRSPASWKKKTASWKRSRLPIVSHNSTTGSRWTRSLHCITSVRSAMVRACLSRFSTSIISNASMTNTAMVWEMPCSSHSPNC